MTSHLDYLDFELTVEKAEAEVYRVLAKSGNKSAECHFTNPFSEDKLALIKATTKSNIRASQRVRSTSGASEVKQIKAWGTQLFEQAVSGDVSKFYEECKAKAEKDGQGVRWRLALDSFADDLPWEFLCTQDDFLALNPFSPVVRYIPRSARLTALKESERPLRVLVVIASPSDEAPLDAAVEKERIIRVFETLTAQGLVELSFIEGRDTWQRLYDALFKNETHILHFIGHGAYDAKREEGVLIMEDADGKGKCIASEGLRVLVQGRSRLRLVVLNSCSGTEGDNSRPLSSVAAGLIQSGVPAVIAMQAEISDDAAKEIADTFYKSLAFNMPVDTALTEARRKIYLFGDGSLEFATPILFMQVPNGELFQFEPLDKELPPRPKTDVVKDEVSIAPATKEFEEQAARFYAQGEQHMARGSWTAAIAAFQGARDYVPLYRDVAQKLAICENRAHADKLYAQAQQFCAEKKYAQAISTLTEASRTIPGFVDTLNVRVYAECGQKYERAIAELEKGNRDQGAALLRDIIEVRPDFEDAKARLSKLASGELVPVTPKIPTGSTTETWWEKARRGAQRAKGYVDGLKAAPTADKIDLQSRLYAIPNTDPQPLVESVNDYFTAKGYESQIVEREGTWLIQGKKPAGIGQYVGLGEPATVIVEVTPNKNIKVSVGCAKWLEKGGALLTAAFVPYVLIAAYVGRKEQTELIAALWQVVEAFMAANGGRSAE